MRVNPRVTNSAAKANTITLGIGGRDVPGSIRLQPARLCEVNGIAVLKGFPMVGVAHATAATTWLASVAGQPLSKHTYT